jgi:transaldolase/glucose-6-phosphate isomerase
LISLDEAGTSVWLDYIRRKLVQSGELQRMVDEDGLRGMTSNPTIFGKSIAGSTDYDVQIRDLVEQGKEPLEIFQIISTDDIREACDVLRPIYDRLHRYDGYVSIEVSPGAANDTAQSLDEARHLWKLVGRPNVMIKIPGTEAGLPAIEQLIFEGVNVNITLLFDVDNYAEVAERYIRGLERRAAAGLPVDGIASVASFFVSRVDTAVDTLLQAEVDAATDEAEKRKIQDLMGKAAIANAKIAYERFREIFNTDRWAKLGNSGAMVQRPLWASTSTKNPSYRDVMYVEELIGPDTVNTMPQSTMNEFKDHGVISPTLTQDLEGAHRVWAELKDVGIDLLEVTRKLQVDGVRLFAESFNELLECIDSERTAIMMSLQRGESESLGKYEAPVEQKLQELRDQTFVRRLWEKDGSLWTDDRAEQEGIKKALGWLNIVEQMQEQTGDLKRFAEEIRAEGITHAVVLGMGGSSLCPDVLAHTFGHREGYPQLEILDTTDPDAIRHLTERIDAERTLFIVSSKSGTTAEPLAFYHYFWKVAQDVGLTEPGSHFIAITDPGTPLESEARERGFRRIFPGDPDIGGRYSALSNFGMVPAAVAGIDVGELLSRAETMIHATQPCVNPAENPGVRLGTILGVLAKAGRDKLTFAVSPEIATFGWWLEQLIAESTGKSGTGIVPVEGETLGEPDVYGSDRQFVGIKMRHSGDDRHGDAVETDFDRRLRAIEQAGHPVVVLELNDVYDIGGEFFLWEVATATAGAVLRINAFNQPNVQESKDNTNRLLATYQQEGRLPEPEAILDSEGVSISGPTIDARNPSDYLIQFLDQHIRQGVYVAFMAYIEPTAGHSDILRRIRIAERDRYQVATTAGYGPRFLHSTGQLHKGGPDEGVFIQVVARPEADVSIPDKPFGFATLIAAQALGDYQALQKHGRWVVRVDLGSEVERGLREIESALTATGVA